MNKKHLISKFYKNKPSFYKLSNNQIKQLLDYLKFEINPEELNNAIGYTSRCPYCFSENIYKTENKSHLYKFKCENCNKKFTSLSKSVISDLLLEEYINRGEKLFYKEALKNIEVWLCFDVQHDRRYKNIPRENIVGNISDWRYNLLKLSHNLKNEHLVSIHVQSQESFYKLLDFRISEKDKKKFKEDRNKRFIVLTFQEGSFTPKQSLNDFGKKLMKYTNSFQSYQDDVQKKNAQQEYLSLKNKLIKSYNDKCEILSIPNREDKIYKDVEVAYKHTYSLAFEMAIRNSEVKKILYALKYLKSIKAILDLVSHKDYNLYKEDLKFYRQKLLNEYPYYLSKENHEKFILKGLIIINELIKDFENDLLNRYQIIPKENKVKTPEAKRILIQRAIYNSFNIQTLKYKEHKIKYKYDEQIYDDYIITTGMFEGDNNFDVSTIRPTYNLHIVDNNTFHIPINLNLPTEEITAFIEKIKQHSQKNLKLIKSPMELLGDELETIDSENVEQYFPKTFKGRLKTMANALFAYDLFNYLLKEQTSLESERDSLQYKLDYEKEKYKRQGRRTSFQIRNIKRIEKKYNDDIAKFNKKLDSLDKTSQAKYESIGKKIDLSVSVIERYISFMHGYIEKEKYKRLFTKTK